MGSSPSTQCRCSVSRAALVYAAIKKMREAQVNPRDKFRMKIIRRLAAACLAALPWSASRDANAADTPLVIAKSGYVFAGGKIDTSLPGSPMIGQLYAEFQ